MAQTPFVHLHTHSHFSLLQALPKISELVDAAAADEMPALALTDSGNLYGAIDFYKTCKKAGIKSIIGVDAYVAHRTRHDREPKVDTKRHRLVLLAENNTGYRNLLSLVTRSYLEGFYYKPRVDRELLAEYAEGLIAIIPSFSGEVADALRRSNTEQAREILDWYVQTYGKKNIYLELTHHPEFDNHETTMERIKTFAKEQGVPLVAAHDTYYLKPEDRLARETLVKVQTQGELSDTALDEDEDFSFITQKRANELFQNEPEALAATKEIADRCTVELELGSWVFPDLAIPEGTTYDEQLRKDVYEGLARREMEQTSEVKERIEYELKIIKDKGFSPYFLVVADLLKFARDNNILTTTRGSAAGSLVSYLVGITNVDPMEYKLPFERFLNPERPKAPDIDMDFADDRRDEVLQYAREKYGDDKVAQIGTFGTMMARGSVRDTARALGYPYALGDRIAKLIPFGSQGFPMSIERALEMVPELQDLQKKDEDARRVLELAQKIEGCARHISIHAAGVVISPSTLTDYVPLQLDPKGGKMITQYDMHAVEEAGLLKFDFLGIKNLAILADSVERVKANHRVDIDIEHVPLDDAKTFEMLARGETHGLFQLGGGGMTRYLKELKPTTIHDINAMVALYRPGPMESIPSYIERKHNPQLVTFLDERMRDILDQSFGVLTYQDDVLLIAVNLAGYSWKDADALRKAMGKKIPAEMEAQREKFTTGAIDNGMSKEKAEKLWRLIEPFAAYGFNKSHAASYGKVAYQTAYMKANYPVEYMAAVLSADSGDTEKIAEHIGECARMEIPVLPPDVNESFGNFTVVKDDGKSAIRFGLFSIKNFGEGIGQAIIDERERSGAYDSLADFFQRLAGTALNRKAIEALIKSGAMDSLEKRGAALANLERLLQYAKEQATTGANQDSLFAASDEGAEITLEDAPEVSARERLAWEKELLGVYVSGHPLDAHKEKLARQKFTIKQVEEEVREGMTTVVCGLVEDVREILTKKGDRMAFLRLADFSGSIEAVAFPQVLADYKDKLAADKCIAVKGRFSKRNDEPSIIIEAAKDL